MDPLRYPNAVDMLTRMFFLWLIKLFDEDRKLILKYTNNLRVRYGPAPPTVSVHPKCLKDLDSVMLGLILDLNDIELRKRC